MRTMDIHNAKVEGIMLTLQILVYKALI